MRGIMRIALQNFAILFVAACIAYYAAGMLQALLVVSVGSVLAAVVSISELRLNQKLDYASELSDAFFVLHLMHTDMRYGGKPLHFAIGSAARSISSSAGSKMRGIVDEIGARLALGQDFGQAITTTCNGKEDAASAAMLAVCKEYQKSFDAASAIKNVYVRLWKSRSLSMEKGYGSLQKYLTISMALSAVLPSFAVFAFVGYSMVYYSTALLSGFMITMLVVLPDLYALLKMHIAGVYAQ